METSELIKKVRKIEIRTRGLSKHLFSGDYHSVFKGRGMAFSEVREYQPGDDIRTIDWNVTARYADPYVKIFEEERELTVMLMVDISGSQQFGTSVQYKRNLITEICAVLAFSAIQNNDKIGVIFFTDKIEKFIPPKKGKAHTLRIIRELIEIEPKSKGTDIGEALVYLTNMLKKRGIVFLFSDFISKEFEQSLKITARKHDTIAIRIFDKSEEELPDVGIIRILDAETGKAKWIDTSHRKLRENYSKWWESVQKSLDASFSRCKVDSVQIRTDKSYIVPLQNFFKLREKRK